MQIKVFSMAISMERANVPMASESEANLVKLLNEKCPLPSWNAYTRMSTSGSTTKNTRKIRYGIHQLLLLFIASADLDILCQDVDSDEIPLVPGVIGVNPDVVSVISKYSQMVMISLV